MRADVCVVLCRRLCVLFYILTHGDRSIGRTRRPDTCFPFSYPPLSTNPPKTKCNSIPSSYPPINSHHPTKRFFSGRYDPNRKPDPERWIAKSQRGYNKRGAGCGVMVVIFWGVVACDVKIVYRRKGGWGGRAGVVGAWVCRYFSLLSLALVV